MNRFFKLIQMSLQTFLLLFIAVMALCFISISFSILETLTRVVCFAFMLNLLLLCILLAAGVISGMYYGIKANGIIKVLRRLLNYLAAGLVISSIMYLISHNIIKSATIFLLFFIIFTLQYLKNHLDTIDDRN